MLLNSVIIILREVLEAALLFSILLALTKQSGFSQQWFVWSIVLGMIGAVIYGMNIITVSDWFDGVGQEVTNAFIQLSIYFMLVIYMIFVIRLKYQSSYTRTSIEVQLIFIMVMVTAFAIMREGSEILLYFFSVTRAEHHYSAVLMGMSIGTSIGVSVGFLFYYLLIILSEKWAIMIALVLLILVSAGMVSQASLLLIQADWLPSQLPLWNTSSVLSESSIVGQLLYALIGYEATPTGIQISLYLAGLALPVILILMFYQVNKLRIKEV